MGLADLAPRPDRETGVRGINRALGPGSPLRGVRMTAVGGERWGYSFASSRFTLWMNPASSGSVRMSIQ
jgi:hypothetical protein